MERGSAQHGARVDDELADESASLLHSSHGTVVPGREREDLEPEAPTADEQLPPPEPPGRVVGEDVPKHSEVIARSELARWLLPSAFPAQASTLAAVARKQGAPDDVTAPLDAVTSTRIFDTVGELWIELGGVVEHRSTADSVTDVEPETPPREHAVAPDGDPGRASAWTEPPVLIPTTKPDAAEALVKMVTLPPRIAIATARAFGRLIGRSVTALTGSDRPES
jgi:hypothetical protein